MRELVEQGGVKCTYRSFPAIGHAMHAQDPELFASALVEMGEEHLIGRAELALGGNSLRGTLPCRARLRSLDHCGAIGFFLGKTQSAQLRRLGVTGGALGLDNLFDECRALVCNFEMALRFFARVHAVSGRFRRVAHASFPFMDKRDRQRCCRSPTRYVLKQP